MKTQRNILIAFMINLSFSIFEFLGGLYTGSIAIISDAVHDIGDAASIGLAYFLEKKSKKQPDEIYTYGYARYSVLGSLITTLILLIGSAIVIYNAIGRIISPAPINYNGMIIFAIVGAFVNLAAAIFTRDGDSLNQKAVNLHMLEDVFGWLVVLIGAIVMRFTDFLLLDPILSICVAIFILINASSMLKEALNIFLEKIPQHIKLKEIKDHIMHIDGVLDVHHIHIWSINNNIHCCTIHIVTNAEHSVIKNEIRKELKEHGISHITLELESESEHCEEIECHTEFFVHGCCHHHHH